MSRISKYIKVCREGKNPNLTIEGFKYSPVNILAHIERLGHVKVIAKKSWFITDDFEAYFTYKGHTFILYTTFAEVEIEPFSENIPKEITEIIFEHIKNYKIVLFHLTIAAGLKYFVLPFDQNTNELL